jgi:hypothetical protein
MWYDEAEPLQPQLAEDITEAVWCSGKQVNAAMFNTYGSVKEVVEKWKNSVNKCQ